MVALVALAIHDANNMAISVYRSFSPSTALDDALTSNVKINGIITRRAATNSTVDELIEGEAGNVNHKRLCERCKRHHLESSCSGDNWY